MIGGIIALGLTMKAKSNSTRNFLWEFFETYRHNNQKPVM